MHHKTVAGVIGASYGPCALVRHPRYAGEAALNVILAAFTSAWLPLLGVLGWPALRRQAQLEEEWLLRVLPEVYGEYAPPRRLLLLPQLPPPARPAVPRAVPAI